jgi:AcrR family transcriptional regulator
LAYEVVKTVGKRAYRYRVTSFRDPKSGKSKGRWEYLGRARISAGAARPPRRDDTKQKLITALEVLVQKKPLAEITVGNIAAQAKLTPATFYRHFENKAELMIAALSRLRELMLQLEQQASFDPPLDRERFKKFIRARFDHPVFSKGLAPAAIEARFSDPKIAEFFEETFKGRRLFFRSYITALNAKGLGYGDNPEALTNLLVMFWEGAMGEVRRRRKILEPREFDLLAECIARMVLR